MTIKLLRKVFQLTSRPVFTLLFTMKMSKLRRPTRALLRLERTMTLLEGGKGGEGGWGREGGERTEGGWG